MNFKQPQYLGAAALLLTSAAFPILTGCSLSAKANQNGIVITHGNGNGFDISINSDSRQVEEALTQNQTSAGLRSFLADSANGNITIVATDEGKEVEISANKVISGNKPEAELRKYLDKVSSNVTKEGDKLVIKAVCKSDKLPDGVSWAVNYVLKVPRNLIADLKTANGEISVNGMKHGIGARSTNGKIEIANLEGKLDVETANGEIKIHDSKVEGKLRVHSSNGEIEIKDVTAVGSTLPVDIFTSNGAISFEGDVSEATIESGNGEIDFSPTSKLTLGSVSLHSNNAAINLKLPDNLSAKLEAKTSNGSIDSGAYKTDASEEEAKSVTLSLGTGVGNIQIETNNGSINIDKQDSSSESETDTNSEKE